MKKASRPQESPRYSMTSFGGTRKSAGFPIDWANAIPHSQEMKILNRHQLLKRVGFWIVLGYMSLIVCDYAVGVLGASTSYVRMTINHVPNQPFQKLYFSYHGKRWTEKANSLGLRDREFSASPEGTRILLIGDSFTYGHKMKRDNTWAKILEKKLRGDLQNDSLEIVNAGYGGSCPHYYLKTLRYVVPRLRPTHVLICMHAADLSNTRNMLRYGRASRTYILEEIRLMHKFKDRRPWPKRMSERLFPNLYAVTKKAAKKIRKDGNRRRTRKNFLYADQVKSVAKPNDNAGEDSKLLEELNMKILWKECRDVILELAERTAFDQSRAREELEKASADERMLLIQYIVYRSNITEAMRLLSRILILDPVKDALVGGKGKAWDTCKNLLQQMFDETREFNAKFGVTYFPALEEFKEPLQSQIHRDFQKSFRGLLKEFCLKRHITFFDVNPQFQRDENVDACYIPHDGHWTKRGNQLAALALVEAINNNSPWLAGSPPDPEMAE